MTKWQEQLKQQALNGDQAADDILWETRYMSDDELARYVADNDERIRNTMHMKYLAEKDAKPELVNEYYGMLDKGRRAYAGPGKVDAGGYGKSRTVDDWMNIFGVEPTTADADGKGVYTDKERAAFTNPESPKYYAKLKKPEQLVEIASWQGFDNTDLMDEDIRRASDVFQRNLAVEGYNPDASVDLINWIWSATKGFAMPRIKEAQLEGRPISWQDVTGDLVEAGLNFIPGIGLVSKTGKVVARVPYRWARETAKGAAGSVESMVVPGLSQVYDMNVYDEGPRAEFDPKRFGAQAVGFGGGLLAGNQLLKQGTRQMAAREGAQAAREGAREARAGIGRIGEKTDDILAERQAVLDRNARLAQDRSNVNLTGDVDIKTSKSDAARWQDVADAESNRILTEEANRIGRSNSERQAYHQLAQERKRDLTENLKQTTDQGTYLRNKENEYFDKSPNPIDHDALNQMIEDNGFGVMIMDATDEGVPLRPGFVRVKDRSGNPYIVKESDAVIASQLPDRVETVAEGAGKIKLSPEDARIVEAYRNANEAGARDIVQLPDGNFVYRDNIDLNGNYVVGNPEKRGYTVSEIDMGGRPAELRFQYDDGLMPEQPKKMAEYGGKEADRGHGLGDVRDRNQAVKKTIEKDSYLARKMNGGGNLTLEQLRDAAVSFGINSAFHNDLIKSRWGNIDDKRAEAWWNSQMKKLSEFTSSKYEPKVRKKNFEAVMDVMSYGLDNIPDEKFRRNPDIYHAIAAKLGRPDWKHHLEEKTVVLPTNSISTYNPESSSSAY